MDYIHTRPNKQHTAPPPLPPSTHSIHTSLARSLALSRTPRTSTGLVQLHRASASASAPATSHHAASGAPVLSYPVLSCPLHHHLDHPSCMGGGAPHNRPLARSPARPLLGRLLRKKALGSLWRRRRRRRREWQMGGRPSKQASAKLTDGRMGGARRRCCSLGSFERATVLVDRPADRPLRRTCLLACWTNDRKNGQMSGLARGIECGALGMTS
ncbi:hypothetical protein IWZ03DRAFT_151269 [Phyllosticta citriasiana]|uniref:Uncharacterized protein n=1 Tax=Phyllosticta citriasiana TaxID=595635 RepID=A0ABR1KQA2_9PEZI